MNVITKYRNDENFHTTLINCIFEFKYDKNEVMALNILTKLLSKTNEIYPEINLFAREKLNRYIMNLNVINQSINDVFFINFSMLIPSTGVIKDNYLEHSVNFLLDTIYKPNINNFELFEREKRLYIEMLLNSYKNIEFIAEKNMLDLIDDSGNINKIKYKDMNNIKDLSMDDIVNVYNKYIKNIKPKIFIYGNIDSNRVEETIINYINKYNLKDYKIIKDYNYFYKNQELIDVTENSGYHQSVVYMVYNVMNYSEEDFYKLYMINLLLSSSSSDLLLNNLRKKNNLVYSCASSVMLRNGLLVIKATTNKYSIKLCKMIIEKVVSDLKNIELYNENINKILYRLTLNIEREKDNFFINPSDVINKYFKMDISSNEVLNILKNIKMDNLVEMVNRLNLVCIYTLEGVE